MRSAGFAERGAAAAGRAGCGAMRPGAAGLCAARPPGGAITAGGPGAVRERPQPAGPGTARPRAWGATRSAGRQALRRAHWTRFSYPRRCLKLASHVFPLRHAYRFSPAARLRVGCSDFSFICFEAEFLLGTSQALNKWRFQGPSCIAYKSFWHHLNSVLCS